MNRPELARRRAGGGARRDAGPSFHVFTIVIDGGTLGLPIESVRTVFRVGGMSRTPLAPDHILGLINLRGRIVTAISLRRRLGLEDNFADGAYAVSLEADEQNYALVVDGVGDVLEVEERRRIPTPPDMSEEARRMTRAVYACENGALLPVLAIRETLFGAERQTAA